MRRDAAEKSKPIRVLQVLNQLDSDSGVCAVIWNYCEQMHPDQVMFDFLVHGDIDSKLAEKVQSRGCKIYRMPPLNIRNLISYLYALNCFFQSHPEYLIIHGNLPNVAVFYLKAAKKAGVPVRIVHAHLAKGVHRTVRDVRNFCLGRLGMYDANVYFACSKKAAAYAYGKKSKCCHLLRNAIAIDRFRFRAKERALYREKIGVKDALVLGHVGRFSVEKNHMYLLKILHAAKKRGIVCKLLLVGDGKERKQIVRKVTELGLQEDVIFTGIVMQTEGWLQAMDVFAMPSFVEGLPLAGIEAQCSGLPCLFSDAVTREVKILDSTQFLPVKDDSIQEWVNAAVKLCGTRGVDAWRKVEEYGYSIKKEAGRLEKYYIKVAARYRKEENAQEYGS